MGAASRTKGMRGQSEAAKMLVARGHEVVETGNGRAVEDIFAVIDGRATCVEVKNCRALALDAWRKQARAQAKRRRAAWLLMARIPDYPGTFYVEGTAYAPCIWRAAVAK